MTSSDFISNGNVFDEKVPLGKDGATSLSYKVCKEGRLYFMKQLRPELFTNFGNRALLHKEGRPPGSCECAAGRRSHPGSDSVSP